MPDGSLISIVIWLLPEPSAERPYGFKLLKVIAKSAMSLAHTGSLALCYHRAYSGGNGERD
jgi:hypothetical protein